MITELCCPDCQAAGSLDLIADPAPDSVHANDRVVFICRGCGYWTSVAVCTVDRWVTSAA